MSAVSSMASAPESDAARPDHGATRPRRQHAQPGQKDERRERDRVDQRSTGASSTTSMGSAVSTAKVAADASAARTGRAVITSEMPSYVAGVRPQRILGGQLLGDLARQPRPGRAST